jgi:hypothetical protein
MRGPALHYGHWDQWVLGELTAMDGEIELAAGGEPITLDIYCSGSSRGDDAAMTPAVARRAEQLWADGGVDTGFGKHVHDLTIPGSVLTPALVLEGIRRWYARVTGEC